MGRALSRGSGWSIEELDSVDTSCTDYLREETNFWGGDKDEL